jgi:heme-degrading monooxygenase HmoA
MTHMAEMDRQVKLADQLEDTGGPVILINKFEVAPADAEQFLAAWAADGAFFKKQPGFISAQLHRGIAGSSLFVNYAVWESADDFRRASAQPEFRDNLSRYPASVVASPHLFRKVAVPGICVAA